VTTGLENYFLVQTHMAVCNVAPMAPGEGNTKTPPKRISAAKRWVFTLCNYTEDEMALLAPKLEGLGKFIWGEEICPTTGTPHLQGYMEFDTKCRPLEKLKIIRNGENVLSWRAAKASRGQNLTYCTKEWKNIRGNLKYDKPLRLITPGTPGYEWELDILELIKDEADDRTIHWYWEPTGKRGKSSFVRYLCAKHDALCIDGKPADAKYTIKTYKEKNGHYPEIILYDVPRTQEGFVSYRMLEEVKNGCFLSTKYECGMVLMNHPHLLCFANFYPETEKMSEDRWNIIDMDEL